MSGRTNTRVGTWGRLLAAVAAFGAGTFALVVAIMLLESGHV
jgi:hypothetical protein